MVMTLEVVSSKSSSCQCGVKGETMYPVSRLHLPPHYQAPPGTWCLPSLFFLFLVSSLQFPPAPIGGVSLARTHCRLKPASAESLIYSSDLYSDFRFQIIFQISRPLKCGSCTVPRVSFDTMFLILLFSPFRISQCHGS